MMITYLLRTAGVICLIILYACAGTNNQDNKVNPVPLTKLIGEAPTNNSIQSTLVYDAILTYGQEGIVQICFLLESDEQEQVQQAEYVLHGLAIYVNHNERDASRQEYISGLKQALKSDLSVTAKKFIINRLQVAGRDDVVPLLSSFLNDENLSPSAIRALTAIGTESAGKVLLEALPGIKPDRRVAIITALGNINYKPAAGQLLPYLDDTNFQIRQAAYFALSNFDYLPAAKQLERMMQEDHRLLSPFLNYVNNIAARGQIEQAITICRKIIRDSTGAYSPNQQISALYQLVDIDSIQAIDDLFTLSTEENKKIRMAALQLAGIYNQPDMIPKWIRLAQDSPPHIQADIIFMLSKQKGPAVLSFLKESLNSPSKVIRLASIKAYTEALKNESLADIIIRLKTPLDPDEQSAIRHAIVAYADSTFLNELFNYYDDYPVSSQSLIIRSILDIENSAYNSVWFKSISAGDSLLRPTLLEGMRLLGDDNTLPHLISLLDESTDRKEEQATIRAIIAIINRSKNKTKIIDSLIYTYDVATVSKKIRFLKIFRGVNEKKSITKTYKSISDADQELSDAAIRSLALWPDENALDLLIDIAGNNKNVKYRIIALHGAVRILRENSMDDIRALQYYEEIITLASRPEDKRQLLAGLADISEPTALKNIIRMMDDTEVEYEAFLAIMKIASADNITRKEMALVLLETAAQGSLSEKINQYTLISDINNTPPEGFTALFNGKDLSGWKGLVADPVKRAQMKDEELLRAQMDADDQMRKHWEVINGVLYFDGKGSSLCTKKDYTDFEMYVDWKNENEGDSGIYLRGSPQVQIWDPAQWPEGSGGLYNNQKHPNKPLQAADNPIGEWNTFRILMRGEKVTVYLNDILVVDNVIMENYWERDRPIYPTGQIELQSHHTPLYFRNIYIRELEPEPPLFKGDLFNGTDLNGWQVIGNSDQSWQVKDGILYSEGNGGGWLSTTRIFADFKLSLEFRVPPGGNSGVFLHAPHDGNPAYTGMEIQVLDDYAEKYADLKPWQYTGSLYGLQPPAQKVSKNADQWQSMEIICNGPRISVFLNGVQIINANLIDFMSKEKIHPGIKCRSGYIGLQNHSAKIEYRNIHLTEL